MEKELVFHILEIEPTKEEAQIRSAYPTLLKKTNPEDDPEGFKRLREAYEEALSLARETEEEENVPLDDIGFWLNEVDTVYQDIEKRSSTAEWEALISSPVCEDLDTSLDARNRLLGYLMDHFQLPQEIWILLDKSFQLVEDMEQLSQQFPEGFLSYVKSHTENPSFLPYHLFTVRDRNTMNADAYIKHFFDLMHSTDEGTLSESWKLLDEMKAFGLYHPYEDIEKMRLLLAEKGYPKQLPLRMNLRKPCTTTPGFSAVWQS